MCLAISIVSTGKKLLDGFLQTLKLACLVVRFRCFTSQSNFFGASRNTCCGLCLRFTLRKIARELEAQLSLGDISDIDFDQVDRLNDLAKSEPETQTAANITARAEEIRLRSEAAKTDDQTSQFQSLQKAVEEFFAGRNSGDSETQRSSRRRELTKALNDFIAQHHLSNPELVDVARQSVALLSQQGTRDAHDAKRSEMIASVTAAVGDASQFRRNVQDFVEAFPNDEMAADLASNIIENDTIQPTNDWINILSHRGFQDVGADLSDIQAWMKKVGANEQKHHPFAANIQPWKAHFESVVRREGLIKQLQQAFDSKLMKPMYAFPDPNGNVYYSDQNPDKDSDRAHVVSYFTNTNLARDTKNFGLRFRDDVVPKTRLAGHCRFAQSVASPVASISVDEFTPMMYRLISELHNFRGEPDIDPVFRGAWMKRLLTIAGQGSVPIREAFGDWERHIQNAQIDWNLNWIDPNRDQAQHADARKAAVDALGFAGNWDVRVQKMSASYKRFRQRRPPPPRWVGWIAKQDDQYVALLATPPDEQPLYVLLTDNQSKQTSMVPVDTSDLQRADDETILVTNPAAQLSGAMVCTVPLIAPVKSPKIPSTQTRS